MLKHLSFRCFHEFSWPRQSGDGQYYQVCLRCGAHYAYDWTAMRRTKRIENVAEPTKTAAVRSRGHRWRPRERRFGLEVEVLYRKDESAGWQTGSTVNISRSGLLVRAAESMEAGTKLEFIVQMPQEVAGYHEQRVLGRATVARAAACEVPGAWQIALAITDYEFLHEDAIGA